MQLSLIQSKIFGIRGQKVILDFDLAEMYEVETKVLKQAVKKNLLHFPADFMFTLTQKEFQIVTSNRVGNCYLPSAFTEQGVAMLSSVLKSEKVIEVTIDIIRTFVVVRQGGKGHQEFQQILSDAGKKFQKSQGENYAVIESVLNTMKRRRINRKQNLSSLKQTYQRELIQKILLRRLR